MASEDRIWADRGRSNDFRSSVSDSDSGSIELPHTGARTVDSSVMHNTEMGISVGLKLRGRDKVPSSTMETSQTLLQSLESGHPQSSRPQPPSPSEDSEIEDEHYTEEDQNTVGDEESVGDLLEGFDVLESEKDFMLSLLETAPPEEIKALKKVSCLEYIVEIGACFAPAQRSTVEHFAHTHPFWTGGKLLCSADNGDGEVEMNEFKRDVYDYARAAGMGKNQARLEAIRAMAAWRKKNGVGIGDVIEEWVEESVTDPYISSRSSVSSTNSVISLANSEAMEANISKKRKRGIPENAAPPNTSSQIEEFDLVESKRLRKALKKERKKAAREIKKEGKQQNQPIDAEKQIEYEPHVFSIPELAFCEQEATGKSEKKRKRSKLGPVTSIYFPKPFVSNSTSKQDPLVQSENGSKSGYAKKRARKQERAELTSASSVNCPLNAYKPIEETDSVEDVTVIIDPVAFESALANNYHSKISGADTVQLKEKKKRKKKRNQNRLPDEPEAVAKTHNDSILTVTKAYSPSKEAFEFHTEKRPRTKAFMEDLRDIRGDKGEEDISQELDTGLEGTETRGKSKMNRRKRCSTGDVPTDLDQSPDAMPKFHDTEILVVPEYHDEWSEKQEANPNSDLGHENSYTPFKRKRRKRGSKSKGMHNGDVGSQVPEEPAVVHTLTELVNTNTKQPREHKQEQERGRGRTRDSVDQAKMDLDDPQSKEQSKARHS